MTTLIKSRQVAAHEPSSMRRDIDARQLVAVPAHSFERRRSNHDGLRVVDLFAGAGGFGLGFELAGCQVTASLEIDAWACETLRTNNPSQSVVEHNICEVGAADIRKMFGEPDIVIGGPPCQGYSVANLRAGDPKDPRNSLFREFIRVAEVVRPRALLMENVPGLLKRSTACGKRVVDVICDEYRRLGYRPHVRVLQAVEYGVPQLRPRLFVLGLQREHPDPFPAPTHSCTTLASGQGLFSSAVLFPAVTLWDAISDLPEIDAREGAEEMDYTQPAKNLYQTLTRGMADRLFNHVAMHHSERLVQRFASLKWGESGGSDVAPELAARKRGLPTEISGKQYDQNNRRMFPDRPCHTIPASFYANFVHPFRNRNFTPREGARLQSFPDWYRFMGKPTVVSHRLLAREGRDGERHLCQYNQIGNAVPPLLAFHLAQSLSRILEDRVKPAGSKGTSRI